MGTLALVGLGSNLGDRQAQLDAALARLAEAEGVVVRAISSYHETRAVGGPSGQSNYLNAVASVETMLNPQRLLGTLQAIEVRAGRERSIRWGERTLDLDLLLFGDQILDTPELTVPHPRMAVRRFVLAPLAEIAPAAVDPLTGRTVADLLANLDRRPSYVALLDRTIAGGFPLFDRLVEALSAQAICRGELGFGRYLQELGLSGISALLAKPELLDLVVRLMVVDRWSGSEERDRWLVSDFWFDQFFLSLDTLRTSRPRFPLFRERFLEARSQVIAPTFVVALPEQVRRLRLRDPQRSWQRPIGWDTPILVPGSAEPEVVQAEVVAACAASRGGLRNGAA
jgi:2-amino-4-hydroxy-6-hydroxymethyldihydropteridine diphosphokinase